MRANVKSTGERIEVELFKGRYYRVMDENKLDEKRSWSADELTLDTTRPSPGEELEQLASKPPATTVTPEPCGDCDPCLGGRPDQCALFPSKPPAPTVAPCYKCKQPMSMTPVCTACGIIPIATGSFEQLQLEIDRLKADVAKLENQLARTPTRCNEEQRK